MHERQIIYYNTIKAEDFIENLQQLWDNSSLINASNIIDEIQPDWLHFALKMCQDRLPSRLELKSIDKTSITNIENSVAFSIYQVTS